MPIKFSVPSPSTKKIGTSSVKKNSSNLISSKTQGAPASALAIIPITKNAQFAGSGANVTMTQPMFFSPLHTPQNWQIASKRREQYMWSFITPCNITLSDGSLKAIDSIKSNFVLTNIESENIKLLDGYGKIAKADRFSKRRAKKKANKIKVLGVAEPLLVTHDHKCRVIKREDLKCKYRYSKKNCIIGTNTPTCKRAKCNKSIDREYNISEIAAEGIEVGDYLLVPFPTEIKESCIKMDFEARYAGHLASDGWISNNKSKRNSTGICMCTKEKEFVMPCVQEVFASYGVNNSIETNPQGTLVLSRTATPTVVDFASKIISGKAENKKFTEEILYLDPELQKHVLGAYIQSDGYYNKQNDIYEITTYSKHLANQLAIMCYRCGILARVNKQPISKSKGTFKTHNEFRYIVGISSSDCGKISEYVPGKPITNQRKKGCSWRFFWKNYVVSRVASNDSFDYEGPVYDIRVPPTFTVTVNGVSCFQSRFYYENECKVAAGVDFYSVFSMSGFILECSNGKVLRYFEKQVKNLKLNNWLKLISHEYFMLGDVFPFTEIECTSCSGSGVTKDGKSCNHPDGKIKRIVILNPDWIEVQSNALASEPVISLVPDEDLREIVAKREPRQIYDRLPKKLIEMVSKGLPIQLSNRCVSHIKHNASPYGIYGTSLIRRLFTILAYKTKIMTANWIVAERLILPVRIVKVGSDTRPATAADILDTSNQLSAVANDPNLTLVTHHNLDYEWVGAEGKIHNITAEIEQIGKEILDGLMLNQALLNGEMTCHDEDTMTLTEDGFRKYNEIYEDTKIGCYNPKTKKIEYRNYLEKNVYDYSGEMFKFGSDKIDILVTPNHRMWINSEKGFDFIEAQNVENGSEIITKPVWRRQKDSSFGTSKIESIEKISYSGKVFCFRVPYGLFVTKRNGKITVQGNSYSGAQVGVETMIKRLQSWQNTLSEWVENNIFLPIAMMQGFIDEKATKELGEPQYLYPTIKWNDLNLRDKSGHLQLMMQLHDNRIISTQKLLEEFDIDYDQETERLREEAITAGPAGQVGGMGGGGPAPGAFGGMGGGGAPPGGSPMEGGMPGMPAGQPGMPPAGPEMGGGMGAGGEAGGAPGGAVGAPGATAALLPSNFKIGKKGKGGKSLEEMYKPLPPKIIRLTKLEQKMYRILQGADIPNQLFTQYEVSLPGEKQPFVLDFAYPHLGMGFEAQGKIWHENAEAKIRDQQRDQKLANIGWRILRFNEDAIQQQPEAVKAVIQQQVALVKKDKMKKKSENEELIKEASNYGGMKEDNLFYEKIILDNNLGCLYLIGSK